MTAEDSRDLNDLWNVYYHDASSKDWTLKSYLVIDTLSQVRDYWIVKRAIMSSLSCGMFFVMREHIFPCWDDPENQGGGCFSFQVPKANVDAFWDELNARVLGESLVRSKSSCEINGISISPKWDFCIVKLWVSKRFNTNEKIDWPNESLYSGRILFKHWA